MFNCAELAVPSRCFQSAIYADPTGQGSVELDYETSAAHSRENTNTLSQAVSFNIALQYQRNESIHLASLVYGLQYPTKQGDGIKEIFPVFPSVLSLGLSLQSEPCPCMLFHMEQSYYLG